MKISFLVTYYNQEQYVRQSMDSILAIEKPEKWEIIVGDDGSTDGTVNIVNEYVEKDPEHIRLYVMPREADKEYIAIKRASANRLTILEHCSGDCFCTLDGDDFYIDTKFVLEAVDVFEKHDDVSVVLFGTRYFRDGVFEEEFLLPAGVRPYIDTELYIRNFYLHCSAGVHRLRWERNRMEYIKKTGFFDDSLILMNSLNYGRMYYINRSVHGYRQTGESVSAGFSQRPIEGALCYVELCDVGKMIIIDQKSSVTERYLGKILRLYVWKNKIRSELGESKYQLHIEAAKHLDNAISYRLLVYESLDRGEKRKMRRFVLRLFFWGICKKVRRLFSKYKQDV